MTQKKPKTPDPSVKIPTMPPKTEYEKLIDGVFLGIMLGGIALIVTLTGAALRVLEVLQ